MSYDGGKKASCLGDGWNVLSGSCAHVAMAVGMTTIEISADRLSAESALFLQMRRLADGRNRLENKAF